MLTVATYNIRKGHSLTRGSSLSQLKAGINDLSADILCLQEVQDVNTRRATTIAQHGHSQLAALQGDTYAHCAYGANAFYDHGHHGNAILSKFPIHFWENIDVSDHRLEQRGVLHAVVEHPRLGDLHVLCAHFGLFKGSRIRQAQALIEQVQNHVPDTAPLIIAGDFNDWNLHVHQLLTRRLSVADVLESANESRLARTFPVQLPWFRLDRLYTRHLNVQSAQVHSGREWRTRSDHAPISALLL
ncbi:endonuclease [Formosimonas limnophila]|uniref:Endonuclease n=1 Tax=Formosimonas limnophila TaxID=1384487 RepID=A0A8J3CNR0_9BURK|nr:endonuclease/exonuclease/phosphatase family protein [Formosimonas limnophila]GHA77230.1 endonuclease [Formosimonas limnophila]